MTDREAFIRAICAAPDDDLPRLVFADWLDEQAENLRAAFIRDAVELERLGLPDGPCPPGCPCGGVGDRLAKTVAEHGDEWNPLLPGEKPGDLSFVWRRGFPADLTCTLAAFLAHAPALFAAHPITTVRLTDREPDYDSYEYSWYDERFLPAGESDNIPQSLAAIMNDMGLGTGTRRYRHFVTRDAALESLSAACVAYGRQLAGLPPSRPGEKGAA